MLQDRIAKLAVERRQKGSADDRAEIAMPNPERHDTIDHEGMTPGGRAIRKYKGSTRLPGWDPESWRDLGPAGRKHMIELAEKARQDAAAAAERRDSGACQLKVVKLRPEGVIPKRATCGAAGLDISATFYRLRKFTPYSIRSGQQMDRSTDPK